MGRRRKTGASKFGIDLTVPECLKPLVDNKDVLTYIITRCTENRSNKIYIFVVASQKKKMYLVRFWGAFCKPLSGMYEVYDKKQFQKLIDEKAEKGYRIVDAADTALEEVYGEYATQISDFISKLSKIPVGSKVPLPLTL